MMTRTAAPPSPLRGFGEAGLVMAMLLFAAAAVAQRVTLGDPLVLHVLDLAPDADVAAFEQHVSGLLASPKSSGERVTLLRADRGNRKGQYVLAGATTRRSREVVKQLQAGSASYVKGPGTEVEYRLVGHATAGAPPDVDVLGIHYMKVRPDRRDAFDRYVAETLHPAVANLRPDLRLLYYKSATDPGSYITVFALTRESRDKYWPKGSDSDEVRAAFGPVRHLTTELSGYLVEGSYLADQKAAAPVFESREWTDFVSVRAERR
jgi:hypothetical protein